MRPCFEEPRGRSEGHVSKALQHQRRWDCLHPSGGGALDDFHGARGTARGLGAVEVREIWDSSVHEAQVP